MSKCVLIAFISLYAATALAQPYRWVDKEGRVHYSDTPPAGAAAKSVENRSGTGVIETSQMPYAVQQAAKNFPVTIYTSQNCGDGCKDARALLNQRGVPFREVAVGDDKSRAELKRVSGEEMVPVMTVGSSVTKGFEPQVWHSALDAGGYPRSAPPARKPASAPASAAKDEAPKAAEPAQPRGPYAPR